MNRNKDITQKCASAGITMLVAFCLCAVIACDDDEAEQPSYITSLVEAYTDGSGNVRSILTDEGNRYAVEQDISTGKSDTIFRCLSTYVLAESGVTLYSLEPVFSAHPRPATEFHSLPCDPVKFISSWTSDRYVNMRIGVLVTDKHNHAFGFAEDSVAAKNGKRTAFFTLLHQRQDNDAESYTEDMFLSMPRANYQDCDSFVIKINTYDGVTTVTH